jgi:hypothetical protein
MESKALALGKQIKAEALNSNVHQMEVTLIQLTSFQLPLLLNRQESLYQ